jgi:hypothetical protein
MGGGREILMPTSISAIAGIGNASANARSIVPKSNFIFCCLAFLYMEYFAFTVRSPFSGAGSA